MSGLINGVYEHSPLWLQQLGVAAYGLYRRHRRFGSEFERLTSEYEERETWDADRMTAYVDSQLREQLLRAFHDVPFYRSRFLEQGISDDQLRRFRSDQMATLPMLEKARVRESPRALLAKDARRRALSTYLTSGTTGAPIRVMWDAATHRHNMAVREARSLRWAGVSYRDSRAVIGGRMIVPRAEGRPPFWRWNPAENQLYLSAFHISRSNAPAYAAALTARRPTVLTGYASSVFSLARFFSELGLTVPPPRAVITESEKLEPEMRAVIEAALGAPTFEEYGSVENCALATECECHRLHVHQDFGYVEIVGPDGTPTQPGEVGEIVVTGFANPHQVFVRYRIGDLAAWSAEACPCGRSTLPVLHQLVGRVEDMIIGPDGREVVRFHGLFVGLSGVVEGQVVQETPLRYTVNVSPSAQYSERDRATIESRLRQRVGSGVTVEVRLVPEIPRDRSGKFRAVISKVKRLDADVKDGAR